MKEKNRTWIPHYGEKYYSLRKASHFVKWSQQTAGIFKIKQPLWRAVIISTYNIICHSITNIHELSTKKSNS